MVFEYRGNIYAAEGKRNSCSCSWVHGPPRALVSVEASTSIHCRCTTPFESIVKILLAKSFKSTEAGCEFEISVRKLCYKMAKLLLLADSNYVNNIGDYCGRRIKDLEVKSCQSRKSAMAEISGAEEGIVVVSCLDMIASDVSKSTPVGADSAVEVYYNQLLFKMVEKVDESDGKLAFGLVAPLFWTSLSEEIRRSMNHTYKLMKKAPLNNVMISDYVRGVNAGADGTHLTSNSAGRYIKHIHDFFGQVGEATGLGPIAFIDQEQTPQSSRTDWAEDSMDRPDPDAFANLGPPMDDVPSPARTATMLSASLLDMDGPRNSAPVSARSAIESTQARLIRLAEPLPNLSLPPPALLPSLQHNHAGGGLDRRVGALEAMAFYNNVAIAGLKEEMDTEANKAMLNRITISGVAIPGLEKMGDDAKVPVMKEKVKAIIDSLKEDGQVYEVQFVRHLNKQQRGQKSSVIEVKLADAKQAKELRNEFVKKQKSLAEKINITPVVRLATRVRVEIMHSIAQLVARSDSTVTKAMCVQFIPKPVIKVVRRSFAGIESARSMTFTEAVCWVKQQGLERALDLRKAYERVGAAFRGTRAQHFVLLN